MPHSSGGGSSVGGTHGGSAGSSGYYRSSKTYFEGSRLFYYYEGNVLHRIYLSGSPKAAKKSNILSLVILSIVFLAAIFVFVFSQYRNPKKLNTTFTTNDIVITDTNNIIDDESKTKLNNTLEIFLDKTGIAPAVIFISNDEWKTTYSSLEKYAYHEYVKLFNDEDHWLIVYSSDKDRVDANWSFEGMQGDNTDSILSERITDNFNNEIYNSLKTKNSPFESINKAFSNLNETVMESGFYTSAIVVVIYVAIEIAVIFGIVGSIKGLLKMSKYSNAVEVKADSKIARCELCGTEYIVGVVTRCPKCKASLPGDDSDKENKNES